MVAQGEPEEPSPLVSLPFVATQKVAAEAEPARTDNSARIRSCREHD
jgi:hypothetical protein